MAKDRKGGAVPEEMVSVPQSTLDRMLAIVEKAEGSPVSRKTENAGSALKASGWTIKAGSRPSLNPEKKAPVYVVRMDGHGRKIELVPSTAQTIADIIRPHDAGLADALVKAADAVKAHKPNNTGRGAADLEFTAFTI